MKETIILTALKSKPNLLYIRGPKINFIFPMLDSLSGISNAICNLVISTSRDKKPLNHYDPLPVFKSTNNNSLFKSLFAIIQFTFQKPLNCICCQRFFTHFLLPENVSKNSLLKQVSKLNLE